MNKTEIMQINPLSEKEFSELEKYLEKYAPVDEYAYRIETMSALDGYLTALISSPVHYSMDFWLKPLFNFEKVKMKTVEKVINLLLRHYNSIVHSLNVDPENSPFEPIFDYLGEYKNSIVMTDFWCMGYLKFIELSDILVNDGEIYLNKIIKGASFMFSYHQENENSDEIALPSISLSEKMVEEVIEAVYELHILGRITYLQTLEEELETEYNITHH